MGRDPGVASSNPLAMQEVVGSSPIIRLEPPEIGGFWFSFEYSVRDGTSDLLLTSDGPSQGLVRVRV